MWRFLWRPRWLISHLFVLALVVTMVNLGLWQLRRLDERRALNALVEANLDEEPVPIEQVEDPASDRFRRVTVDGTEKARLRVHNRTLDGAVGEWHLAVVALSDGRHALVNRGFGADNVLEEEFDGPIEGFLIPRDRLDRIARIDLDQAFDRDDVVPALVVQTSPAPAGLVAVPSPELGNGPHLGYAVQWFIFSAIAIAGYPFILRRVARERRDEAAHQRDVDRELAELLEDGGR